MTSRELAEIAAKTLDEKLAENIVLIDVAEKSSFADFLVLANGRNQRQVASLADDVEDALAEKDLLVKSIEGKNISGWILMDFGDIIVNLFTPEMRDKYNIEKIWADCPVEHIGD